MDSLKLAIVSLVFPVLAIAEAGDLRRLNSYTDSILDIIALLIPMAFAAAILFFFYGLALFVMKGGEDKENGKGIMIWGTVAIFFMASIFGIVNFMRATVGFGSLDTEEKGFNVEKVIGDLN